MTVDRPRIWVLLGHRRGDNNQLLALAESLSLPFETRTLNYNPLRRVPPKFLGETLVSLDPRSRTGLVPPWPDLVIGIGRRSVPVARWIRKASSDHTRLVRVGDPRLPSRYFDLIVTTPQYTTIDGPNVLHLPLAMSRFQARLSPDADEAEFLKSLPRPHLLMAVGGWTKFWEMPRDRIARAASYLCERAARTGGSLIVVNSPRTEQDVLEAIREILEKSRNCPLVDGQKPRFQVLLEDGDEIFVTADSVSMISEAIATGKPVGLIPIRLSTRGLRKLGRFGEEGGYRRDLRHFWAELSQRGMVGTVENPLAAEIANPATTAAEAVLALLKDG